jgi:hypothetical protein
MMMKRRNRRMMMINTEIVMMRVMRMEMLTLIRIWKKNSWRSPIMKKSWVICLLGCFKILMIILETFREIMICTQMILIADQRAIHQVSIEG